MKARSVFSVMLGSALMLGLAACADRTDMSNYATQADIQALRSEMAQTRALAEEANRNAEAASAAASAAATRSTAK